MKSVAPLVVVHIGDSTGVVAAITLSIEVYAAIKVCIARSIEVDVGAQFVVHEVDFRCELQAPISNLVQEDIRIQFRQADAIFR